MQEGIFYRCTSRADAVEAFGTGYEAWKNAHVEAMLVRDLEGWITDVLACHEGAVELHREVCQLAEKVSFDNPAMIAEAMLRVFDSTIHLLGMVADGVGAAQQRGYEADGAQELCDALLELKGQRAAFARIWPRDGALWDRASADVKAGKVRTLSEARDELRRRRSRRNP